MSLNREGWNTGAIDSEIQQVDIGLVANRVRTNTNYFKVLVEFLEHVNMPLTASIRDAQNYIRAMDAGISVFDLPPSRVARDLQQWQLLLNWLNDKLGITRAPLKNRVMSLRALKRVVARRNTKAMALVLGELLLRSECMLQGPPFGAFRAIRTLCRLIAPTLGATPRQV